MARLKAARGTWVKALPKDSATLDKAQKFWCPEGKELAVLDCHSDVGGHILAKVSGKLTVSGKVWKEAYLFGPHWKGFTATQATMTRRGTPGSPPGSPTVKADLIYCAQNDNKDWQDDGSRSNLRYGGVQCGLTSAAMVLSSVWDRAKVDGLSSQHGGQFENWVASEFKRLGLASIQAQDHVSFFKAQGLDAYFTTKATVGQLKDYLAQGQACVLGLAYKSSGHFVTAAGIDRSTGDVLIHDPYGKRQLTGSFNQWEAIAQTASDTAGQWNRYSPDILNAIWADGGEASGWAVFLSPAIIQQDRATETPSNWLTSAALTRLVEAIAHPDLDDAEIQELVAACLAAFTPKNQLGSRTQVLHFLSQCAHESGGFYWLEELASGDDYEGRDDLGNTHPGDGRRFKGHGLIQLTGRANHEQFFAWKGLPTYTDPKQVAKYPFALEAAVYFWVREGLGEVADEGLGESVVKRITKRINGGYNGLDDRLQKLDKLQRI